MRDVDRFKQVAGSGARRQNGKVVSGSGGVYVVLTDGGVTLRVDGDGDYRSGQRVVVLGNRIVGTAGTGVVKSMRG